MLVLFHRKKINILQIAPSVHLFFYYTKFQTIISLINICSLSCLCGQHQSDSPEEGCCRCKCTAFRRFQLLGSIGSTLESEMSRSRIKESYPDESLINYADVLNDGDEAPGDDEGGDDEDGDEEDYRPLRKRRIKY